MPTGRAHDLEEFRTRTRKGRVIHAAVCVLASIESQSVKPQSARAEKFCVARHPDVAAACIRTPRFWRFACNKAAFQEAEALIPEGIGLYEDNSRISMACAASGVLCHIVPGRAARRDADGFFWFASYVAICQTSHPPKKRLVYLAPLPLFPVEICPYRQPLVLTEPSGMVVPQRLTPSILAPARSASFR